MEDLLGRECHRLIVKFSETAVSVRGRVEIVLSPTDEKGRCHRELAEKFMGTCAILGTLARSIGNGDCVLSHLALRSPGGCDSELLGGAFGQSQSATGKLCNAFASTIAEAGAFLLRFPSLRTQLSPSDDVVLLWGAMLFTHAAGKPYLRDGHDALVRIADPCTASIAVLEAIGGERGPAPQYVTLDQIATYIKKGKRTAERWKTAGKLPPPNVEGGGGKADYWIWSTVRPVLEQLTGRKLDEVFPNLFS